MRALVARFFVAPWRAIAADAAEERRRVGLGASDLDPRVPAVMMLVAIVAVFQWYVGDRDFFAAHFSRGSAGRFHDIASYAWWTGAKLVGYLVLPLVVVAMARVPPREINLGTAGTRRHLGAYALLYLAVLPVVALASCTHAFQSTYPFYKLAARSWLDLAMWELLYASSFVALELFFRGFMLGLLRRSLGPYAIFVMIVPYCMVHFGKPAVESVGAIFAGVALGTLAMATRSIWGGVLIHVSIAWTMDLLAILQTTGLPNAANLGRFYPHS